MNVTTAEDRKQAAFELARQIALAGSEENARRLVYEVEKFIHPAGRQAPAAPDPAGEAAQTIGIWKAEAVDGRTHFVRDPLRIDQWGRWAQVHQIPPRSAVRRVVLLGESVARGYFFEPYYTVASVLGHVLNGAGGEKTEVVDLAKVGLELDELAELTARLPALQPDVLVLFAGNNWPNHVLYGARSGKEVHELLSQEGMPAVRQHFETLLARRVSDYLAQLRELCARSGIDLVLVIPEFNLADWHADPCESQLVPARHAAEWVEARQRAESSLQQGEWAAAEPWVRRLIGLDDTHPLGHSLLGHLKARQQDWAAARTALEAARDTGILFRTSETPRLLSVVGQTLRAQAGDGVRVVDLRDVFREYLGGGVPGRRLFMDYCHLTVEGIQVAAAAVVQALLRDGKDGDPGLTDPEGLRQAAFALAPERRVAALAHLYAALHNAHNGQPAELLVYHCRRALQTDAAVAEWMRWYTEMAACKLPVVLCRSVQDLVLHGQVEQYAEGLLHFPGEKLLDADLVAAMETVLAEAGYDPGPALRRLRIRQHGVGPQEVNLLDAYYCRRSYTRRWSEKAYFEARQTESAFYLVSEAGKSLRLVLAYRVAGAPGGQVEVRMNGTPVAQLPAEGQWQTAAVDVPGPLVTEDLNVVTLHWPWQNAAADPARNRPLPAGGSLLDAMHPVLAEIHSFRAVAAAGEAGSRPPAP